MKYLVCSAVSLAAAAGLFYVFMYFNPWVKFQTVENMQMFSALYNVRVQQLMACMSALSSGAETDKRHYF